MVPRSLLIVWQFIAMSAELQRWSESGYENTWALGIGCIAAAALLLSIIQWWSGDV